MSNAAAGASVGELGGEDLGATSGGFCWVVKVGVLGAASSGGF